MSKFNIPNLLWLSLILALGGSLYHLAHIFASVDGNVFLGWWQAIAIDTGLFALAYSIKIRKVEKRGTKILWLGVAMFSVISIYGNLAYGLFATTGNLPEWMVATKPYILAASLPILVLFLSELLSDNRQYAAREAKKEEKRIAKVAELPEQLPSDVATIDGKITNKEQRQQKFIAIYSQKPDATITELATALDVSRGTIRNYANDLGLELSTNGK